MRADRRLKLVQAQQPVFEPRLDGLRTRLRAAGCGDGSQVLDYAARTLQARALASGEPALSHALGTAEVLLDLRLDCQAVTAALLAPALECTPDAAVQIRERFGAAIADLVEGVGRMSEIGALSNSHLPLRKPEQQAGQLEALRKMLLAMVQDVRVVLIKLADHTQALRYAVKTEQESLRRQAAELARDIFAPLANRLGVWQLKWEVEDLSFRILDPEMYKRIAALLDEKRADRERYIEGVIALLKGELTRAAISAEVAGRPKHIFSIYKKMSYKDTDFKSIYDVRAVRVLVNSMKDCYAALGLVHELWSPIPKEFDDYIARPRATSTALCIPP